MAAHTHDNAFTTGPAGNDDALAVDATHMRVVQSPAVGFAQSTARVADAAAADTVTVPVVDGLNTIANGHRIARPAEGEVGLRGAGCCGGHTGQAESETTGNEKGFEGLEHGFRLS
jgi:hypothetical protein